MIAVHALSLGNRSKSGPTSDDFLAIKPTVERQAAFAFRRLGPAEREEAIAEAVAAAFQSFLSLIRRGKDPFQFPSLLANRAVQHVYGGRRVGTPLNSGDVFSRQARQRGDFRLHSLREAWSEALLDNRQTPVLDQVCFRHDFPTWLQSLTPRDRRIANLLAMGHSTKSMAKRFGLSPARIAQLRRELHDGWQEFHGERPETARKFSIEVS